MGYRIGVDVGGTFTDFLLYRGSSGGESGAPRPAKTPSMPADPSEGFMAGLAELAAGEGKSLEAFLRDVELIVHGTTVTTNAILTGNVARAGLVTTRGFRDALAMRRGIREAQYDNRYTAPPPLVPRWLRLGVSERMSLDGHVLAPLDMAEARVALESLRAAGVEAVAICFLHSWANPAHEEAVERLAAEILPDGYVTRSSVLLPQIRFTERVSTTALNVAVGPVFLRYLDRLTARLGAAGFRGALLIMQSNGGVAAPSRARVAAATTLLSGPAAAPTAGLAFAASHGARDFITVDMGGTSFDVCLVKDGVAAMTSEGRIARYPFGLPTLAIHTIGAGGGSVGWIDDGGLLRMGPQSAGADPGPACYGRGGTQATCTDADLLLGYLDAGRFLGGRQSLDIEAARSAVGSLARRLGRPMEEAAAGMAEVIDANMAAGIRAVSVERGHDPREFLLVVGGGAGPVHAAGIARELGLGRILVPRSSSIFCAVGLLLSDLRHDFVRSHVAAFERIERKRLEEIARALQVDARRVLEAEGIDHATAMITLGCDVRYVGQYHELAVPWLVDEVESGDLTGVAKRFHDIHDRLYGYALPEAPLELVNVRAVVVGLTPKPSLPDVAPGQASDALRGRRPVWIAEERAFVPVPVYDGEGLGSGARLEGPAIVELPTTTVMLSPGWRCETDRHGSFLLERP